MTQRRSIWDDTFGQEPKTPGSAAGEMPTNPSIDPIQPHKPASILEQLRTAEPKIQTVRDRSWERDHPNKTYRRVPHQIRETIKDIARSHGYSASQIAQAFLEYAMMCYRRGDFELETGLGLRGQTLMPQGWSVVKKPIWAENAWGTQPPKKKPRRQKATTPLYKQMVNYRLGPELIEQMDEVCGANRSPDGTLVNRQYHDGEVVARFLTFAVEAYQAGRLALREAEDE